MLDADFDLEELSTPAELVVTVAGAPAQTFTLNREKLTLGRAEDNDLPRPGFDHWMSHRGQGNYFDNEFNIDGRQLLLAFFTGQTGPLA